MSSISDSLGAGEAGLRIQFEGSLLVSVGGLSVGGGLDRTLCADPARNRRLIM